MAAPHPYRYLLLGTAALTGLAVGPLPRPAPEDGVPARVLVQAQSTRSAAAAVAAVGGHTTKPLPIIDGVAATIPADQVRTLAGRAGIRSVTADRVARVASVPSDASPAAPASVYGAEVAADKLRARGARGQGVTVALLDTGVTPNRDFGSRLVTVTDDVSGQTNGCVNLSGAPGCADGYGHGTFLAGLIAGSGASSGGRYQGIAPAAKLVSIKVGAADGSADVSNVLAGIQWAVSFRDRYDIRVLNLSLGTDSTQSWRVDPLNYAVERAWAAGIVVVVAAGNRGPDGRTVSKPGDDPWVLTVGAVDDVGTPSFGDDVLPDFSARGPTAAGVAKPDVAAPGAHLVSLRAVGSTIDREFPTYVSGAYRQGSGTSQATAVVSGLAALVFSAKPQMTPNRLKYALTRTARPVAGAGTAAVGRGIVDGYGAAFGAPGGYANRGLGRSTGMGSLDASRGAVRVRLNDPRRTVVGGLQTAQLLTWDPVGFVNGDWSATTWYLTPWYLSPWYATAWYGEHWEGHNWEGCSRGGQRDDSCSYGNYWEGSAWYGAWD